MASNNHNFASFTITQPFLGAPLQFQPALGSHELDQLIDAFVTGSASKQDKLSEVTIDFYNHATVDLNTGALVRRYDVALSPWTFEQSPTVSQSSGFHPPIYTPSPASSTTFADSGYGSISLTPPNRSRGARVSKKPKKDTKKTAEVRLPGFSIMTKDGVDVTSVAGRGTKTKEQREHAHLMRIMKACDDCKRKKVRVSCCSVFCKVHDRRLTISQCDPSHRRAHNEMSRTSTSTTKTSSSSRFDPSPVESIPSQSQESIYNSQISVPSFGTNAIDDFVLFPEDTAFWNPTDISFAEFDSQGTDLSYFDFDMTEMEVNDFSTSASSFDRSFDFSAYEQPPALQQPGHKPLTLQKPGHVPLMTDGQDGLEQITSSLGGQQSISHSRPHPSASSQDSGLLDIDCFSSGLQSNDVLIPSGICILALPYGSMGLALPHGPVNVALPHGPVNVALPHGSVNYPQVLQDGFFASTLLLLVLLAFMGLRFLVTGIHVCMVATGLAVDRGAGSEEAVECFPKTGKRMGNMGFVEAWTK